MKITIKDEVDENLVKFESNLGSGVAIWKNDRPLSNISYDIELEINELFEWGINITHHKENKCSIEFIDNKLIFNAKIISYEDDGVLVLSLGDDIIFIEISDNKVTHNINGYASFFTTPDKVMLYPVEL